MKWGVALGLGLSTILCGCTTMSHVTSAMSHASYTLSVAPLALGPVQVGQVSFTITPQQAVSK